jgi:hypothetical protein
MWIELSSSAYSMNMITFQQYKELGIRWTLSHGLSYLTSISFLKLPILTAQMQTIPQPPAGVTCTQPLIYCCFTSEPHTYRCGTSTPIKLKNVQLKPGQVRNN